MLCAEHGCGATSPRLNWISSIPDPTLVPGYLADPDAIFIISFFSMYLNLIKR